MRNSKLRRGRIIQLLRQVSLSNATIACSTLICPSLHCRQISNPYHLCWEHDRRLSVDSKHSIPYSNPNLPVPSFILFGAPNLRVFVLAYQRVAAGDSKSNERPRYGAFFYLRFPQKYSVETIIETPFIFLASIEKSVRPLISLAYRSLATFMPLSIQYRYDNNRKP
jgi:hypothetical protein